MRRRRAGGSLSGAAGSPTPSRTRATTLPPRFARAPRWRAALHWHSRAARRVVRLIGAGAAGGQPARDAGDHHAEQAQEVEDLHQHRHRHPGPPRQECASPPPAAPAPDRAPPRPRRRRARAPRDPAGLPNDRVGIRRGGARGAARRQGAPRQSLRHQRPVRARARSGAPPTPGAALTRGARRYGAFGKIDDVAVCPRRPAPGAAGRGDP
jgi:hypothetical protein